MQFYGEQKGDTVFFGDKAAKKFGTYWVNDGKGAPANAAAWFCSLTLQEVHCIASLKLLVQPP